MVEKKKSSEVKQGMIKMRKKHKSRVVYEPKALQDYYLFIEDQMFKPLLASKSGKYQLSKGLIHPTQEALRKYGHGQKEVQFTK
jgi:hypothetical protein